MGKRHFTVIIAMVAKRRKYLIGQFHVNSSRAPHPDLTDFFEIFTSGRHHKDIKILKILATNSKWLRFYDILKKWQIEDRGWV